MYRNRFVEGETAPTLPYMVDVLFRCRCGRLPRVTSRRRVLLDELSARLLEEILSATLRGFKVPCSACGSALAVESFMRAALSLTLPDGSGTVRAYLDTSEPGKRQAGLECLPPDREATRPPDLKPPSRIEPFDERVVLHSLGRALGLRALWSELIGRALEERVATAERAAPGCWVAAGPDEESCTSAALDIDDPEFEDLFDRERIVTFPLHGGEKFETGFRSVAGIEDGRYATWLPEELAGPYRSGSLHAEMHLDRDAIEREISAFGREAGWTIEVTERDSSTPTIRLVPPDDGRDQATLRVGRLLMACAFLGRPPRDLARHTAEAIAQGETEATNAYG